MGYSQSIFLRWTYLARIIKHKFQVKKSLSQRPPEARKKKLYIYPILMLFL